MLYRRALANGAWLYAKWVQQKVDSTDFFLCPFSGCSTVEHPDMTETWAECSTVEQLRYERG